MSSPNTNNQQPVPPPDWADKIHGGGLSFRQWLKEYGVNVPYRGPKVSGQPAGGLRK